MPTVDYRYVDDPLDTPEDQGKGLLEYPDDESLVRAESGIPSFGEEYPEFMVPRREWKERCERISSKLRRTTRRIYSQSRTSMCVGFGIGQCIETCGVRLYGRKNWVPICGADIYSHIGRSLMSGAYIPDGIRRVTTVGVLPLRTPETEKRFKHTRELLDYTRNVSPPGSDETARLFLVTKWAKCRGADEIFSAQFHGFGGVVGRSNHCVPYEVPYYRSGGFYIGYPNSWDYGWGDNGWGFDSERTVDRLTCYVVMDMYVRPGLEVPSIAT